MLAKENRLRKKRDFEAIFKNGETFKEGFLILRKTGNNLDIDRFGFIVSQKISKKANIRNKVKRRLREVVGLSIKNHLLLNNFLANNNKTIDTKNDKKRGLDMALIALPGIEKKDFSETKENLIKLFEKAKLIKKYK